MSEHNLEQLVSAYVDGELAGAERAAFEARLAGDPALQAEVEATRALSAAVAASFDETPDAVRRERVFSGFLATAALEAQSAPKSPWYRPFLLPAAAAATLLVSWALGLFDASETRRQGPHEHATLVDLVRNADSEFAACGGDCAASRRANAIELLTATSAERIGFANPADQGDSIEVRRQTVQKFFRSCTDRDVPMPTIPSSFDLVGARVAEVNVGGAKVPVPHILLYSEEARLSVYLFCRVMAEELRAKDPKVFDAIHGCSNCGVLVQRRGEFLMLVVSDPDTLKRVGAEL